MGTAQGVVFLTELPECLEEGGLRPQWPAQVCASWAARLYQCAPGMLREDPQESVPLVG